MTAKFSNSSDRAQDSTSDILSSYTHSQPGSIPGTISIDDLAKPPEINLIEYNSDRYEYGTNLTPEECLAHLSTESVSWIDVGGLGDKATLEKLGEIFKLHPLILADIINVPQRPKLEDHQNQLVIITQMINFQPTDRGIWLEQVSFVLGENYLLTVQEEPQQDYFNPVRDRLSKNKGTLK